MQVTICQKHSSWTNTTTSCNLDCNFEVFTFFCSELGTPLVDHPTQLVFIWIFICWVGGGDPCGAAELCISGLWSQKKQARTDVFLKYPCHVHKDSPEAENGTKNFIKPTKNLFVSLNSQFVPISCSNFSGQIEFGLKSCSNQSGQNDFGLKSCSLS